MSGSSSKPVSVAIIGAGLSGLTAAFRARQAGARVVLYDKAARVGGAIRSERRNGYLLEFGPNTVQAKEDLVSLIDDLKLRDRLQSAHPRLPRYILFQKKLIPVPMSPWSFLNTPLLSWTGRIRLVREYFQTRRSPDQDESVMSYARRNLGPEVAEHFVAPFVSGVWAGDADALSVRSAFPALLEWERDGGSVLRGAMKAMKASNAATKSGVKGLLSFSDGLESLTRALAHALEPWTRLGNMPDEIQPQPNGGWRLKFGGSTENVNAVIVAVPAWQAARYVRPFAADAAHALDAVSYPPLAVLHLGFKRSAVRGLTPGFGFLTLPSDKNRILGCVWNSNLFPDRAPADACLFTIFIGGARNPGILTQTDGHLIDDALKELRPVLGIEGNPDFTLLTRHPSALPQYTLGHEKRMGDVARAETQFPGLHLAGNYRGGVAVSDVVKTAGAVGRAAAATPRPKDAR